MRKVAQRYKKTIAQLEADRAALGDEATLLAWLYVGTVSDAANDALAGKSGAGTLSFTETVETLLEDCEHLLNHASAVLDPAPTPLPRLERAWTSKAW
jgi:hypothetical protein